MKSKYKLWLIDFDGTLVGRNFKYSLNSKNSIKKLQALGSLVSIATGRPYFGLVEKTCKDLNLTSPQIVSGGSLIIDTKAGKKIWGEAISTKTRKGLMSFLSKKNFLFSIEDESYVFAPNKSILGEYSETINFKNIDDLGNQDIYKVVVFESGDVDMNDIQELLTEDYPDLHIVKSGIGRTVLDITSQKGTKHLAALKLMEILKIDPEEVVGIGDGYNDYPLLTACGYKIAMENAPDEVKEIASLVVPTVKDDGLTVAIDKITAK